MTPRRPRIGAALLLAVLVGCRPTNDHPPDQLLQDSLGLEMSDRVYRVELSAVDNRERVRPAELRIPAGAFVEFTTTDRRLHTVRFSLDSLSAPAAEFLRSSAQDASPPLVELESRFVVSFRDAPAGRYPYVAEGNGDPTRGVVVVDGEGSG